MNEKDTTDSSVDEVVITIYFPHARSVLTRSFQLSDEDSDAEEFDVASDGAPATKTSPQEGMAETPDRTAPIGDEAITAVPNHEPPDGSAGRIKAAALGEAEHRFQMAASPPFDIGAEDLGGEENAADDDPDAITAANEPADQTVGESDSQDGPSDFERSSLRKSSYSTEHDREKYVNAAEDSV